MLFITRQYPRLERRGAPRRVPRAGVLHAAYAAPAGALHRRGARGGDRPAHGRPLVAHAATGVNWLPRINSTAIAIRNIRTESPRSLRLRRGGLHRLGPRVAQPELADFIHFGRLRRRSWNSFGPLISCRLRTCRSSSDADGSPKRSIS